MRSAAIILACWLVAVALLQCAADNIRQHIPASPYYALPGEVDHECHHC